MFNTEVLGWKLSCKQNQKPYCKSTEEGAYSVLWPTPLWLSLHYLRAVNGSKGLNPTSLGGGIALGFCMQRLTADVEGKSFMWIVKPITLTDWKQALFGILRWSHICISSGESQSHTHVFRNKVTLVNGVGEGGWLMKNICSCHLQNLVETISSVFKRWK